MADTTITELTVNNNLSAVNYIPISDGTNTTRLGSNSLFGVRNRLINGSFNVAQRGTTISGVSGDYALDRWKIVASDSTAITVDQVSDPYAGAINSMKIANGVAGKRFGVYQVIESANCRDLRGKQVTLSFKIKTSDPTTPAPIAVSIIEYIGPADIVQNGIFSSMPANTIPGVRTAGGLTPTYQAAITPSSPATWYSVPPITTTLGSSFNNLLIALTWMNSSSPSSINKNFELAQVQLEEGPTATPFEFLPINVELAMCQRYYLPIDLTAAILGAHFLNGNTQLTAVPFSVPMRTTPTGSWGTLAGTFWNGVANAPLDTSVSSIVGGNSFWRIGTTGNPGGISPAMVNLTGRMFFTSEL